MSFGLCCNIERTRPRKGPTQAGPDLRQLHMRPGSLAIAALLLYSSWVFTSPLSAEPDFEKDIAPLLVKRCLECHSSSEKKGELDLSTYQSASAGGESGPALGKPGKSLLLKRISSGEMPPKLQGKSRKLPENEIALLREWIAAGAKWPKDRTLSLY